MKCYYLVLTIFLCGMGLAALAVEPQVHDTLVTTTDRTCGVHYLSRGKNTIGWFLTDVEGSCPQGVLQGEGYVVIRNAFGKEVERISGFFTQGYWTGAEDVNVPLVTLYLRDSKSQTLSFDFGHEERLKIRYLGKMVSMERSDGTYGPFMTCETVSILAQTSEISLFEDSDVQQELINSVINRAQNVCPDVEQIYFYGSEKENPENKDIVFFADINMATRQIRVRRLPSSGRTKNILQPTDTRGSVVPKPVEVRHEKALPIVEIKPIIERNEQRDLESQNNVEIVQAIPVQTPVKPIEVVSESSVKAQSKQEVLSDVNVEPVIEEKLDSSGVLDAIPNLLTASRLLQQPVEGKAWVRIARFEEDGSAIVEEPVLLALRGKHLSIGWGIIEGMFSYVSSSGQISGIRGSVQVKNFTPYQQE